MEKLSKIETKVALQWNWSIKIFWKEVPKAHLNKKKINWLADHGRFGYITESIIPLLLHFMFIEYYLGTVWIY